MTQEASTHGQTSSAPTRSGEDAAPASVPAESSLNSSDIPNIPGAEPTEVDQSETRETETARELQRLNRALRALSACNQALAEAGSEQELLDQICDVIVRVGGYRMAAIAFAEPDDEKTLRPVARAGHESGYFDEITLTWSDAPTGRGPAGTAVRENRVCAITETTSDPAFAPWRKQALERGYEAMIALPLRVAGLPFGVLGIYSGQKGSFDRSEVELLTEMANNLAFGITAMRSQEESRRATSALREAEAKYRQLVEEVPAISYLAEAGVEGRFCMLARRSRPFWVIGRKIACAIRDSGGTISTPRIIRWRSGRTHGKMGDLCGWNTGCGGRTAKRSGCGTNW